MDELDTGIADEATAELTEALRLLELLIGLELGAGWLAPLQPVMSIRALILANCKRFLFIFYGS